MGFYRAALIVVALVLTVVPGRYSVTRAQGFGGIPSSAQPALFSAIQASGCQPTDIKCICADKKIFPSVQQAIQKSCSQADQAAVEELGSIYCDASVPATSASPVPAPTPTATTADTELPSSLTSPGVTATTSTSAALVTDTSSSTTYHKTMTYSTTSAVAPTETAQVGGAAGAMEKGLSAAALAVAVGVMSWVFAEL